MKVVYIAGPFRGTTAWDIEQNIRRAEEVSLDVAHLGAAALCPHTNTRFFHGQLTDSYWLDATMELMRRCDAVLLVDGWEKSSGTLGEIKEADKLGLPVFRTLATLSVWLSTEE